MSLRYPEFKCESQEADWLHEHRDLIEAEFLVAGAEGRLLRGSRFGAEASTPWEVAPEDLAAAQKLLHESALWIDDPAPRQPQHDRADMLKQAS